MSDLRELTDAESDIVGGGVMMRPQPIHGVGGELELIEVILVDILRLLEPKQPKPVAYTK